MASRPNSSNSGEIQNLQTPPLRRSETQGSLPDLSEIGFAKELAKVSVQVRCETSLNDLTQSKNERNLPAKYICKKAPHGHKRSVSDTAVILDKNLYVQVGEYPKPESNQQSWYDYIKSGSFKSTQQTPLDKDNAHILLAETVIYCKHQPRRSPVKVNVTPQGVIEAMSAEHILLMLLSMFENPHAIKADEALKLLRDRGDPSASNYKDVQPKGWSPPTRKLIMEMHPKPK